MTRRCVLPGREGGGKDHIIALQQHWPDQLVQHCAKRGPLTVTCQQGTYLKNTKVKQMYHRQLARITSEPEK